MNFKGIVFGIAVFVLTLFVTSYGVNVLSPSPQYEDYCNSTVWNAQELNESSCIDIGGKWVDGKEGYCQRDYFCNEAYNLSQKKHALGIFLISVPLGIIILFVGFYFFRLENIGAGIMAGGVGTMLRGISSYWTYSADWLRFLFSLVGLVIVIWFGYRFSERNVTKHKK